MCAPPYVRVTAPLRARRPFFLCGARPPCKWRMVRFRSGFASALVIICPRKRTARDHIREVKLVAEYLADSGYDTVDTAMVSFHGITHLYRTD